MHDGTLQRTTNVHEVFPDRTKTSASLFTCGELEILNAGSWFLSVSHLVQDFGKSPNNTETLENMFQVAEGKSLSYPDKQTSTGLQDWAGWSGKCWFRALRTCAACCQCSLDIDVSRAARSIQHIRLSGSRGAAAGGRTACLQPADLPRAGGVQRQTGDLWPPPAPNTSPLPRCLHQPHTGGHQVHHSAIEGEALKKSHPRPPSCKSVCDARVPRCCGCSQRVRVRSAAAWSSSGRRALGCP